MPFVDFHALRERVPIDSVASILPIKWERSGEQIRTTCPVHGGSRGLIVTPSKGLFICQASPEQKKGGDCIGLYAHVMRCSNFEAAKRIQDEFGTDTVDGNSDSTVATTVPSSTAPQKPQGRTAKAQPARAPFDPEKFAAKLIYSDEVAALGISEDTAAELGIGFHTQRKRVFFPIRHEDGSKSGFIGLDADGSLILPPQWLPSSRKVVALKRPA